jgi:hypothetical protein
LILATVIKISTRRSGARHNLTRNTTEALTISIIVSAILETLTMFIRCAFFEGHVKAGKEAEFKLFVRENLVPLWTQFPGAEDVRVMHQTDSDTPEPHYALVLAIRYPSLLAIEKALASDVRSQSRDVTQNLIKLFEGRIFHTVFEASHYVT